MYAYEVQIYYYSNVEKSAGTKFNYSILTTILWGIFFYFFIVMRRFFTIFVVILWMKIFDE